MYQSEKASALPGINITPNSSTPATGTPASTTPWSSARQLTVREIEPTDAPHPEAGSVHRSRDSRTWGWKVWALIIGTTLTIAVVAGAIIGGIYRARANAYPKYKRINYGLLDTYAGADFFNSFDYFDAPDPTHGFVTYVNSTLATAANLTTHSNTTYSSFLPSSRTAILRVDSTTPNTTSGRNSVRIVSTNAYPLGSLFIFDVLHSPFGCGTWPALWLVDPDNWPAGGEIDVMESVNMGDSGNHVSLHTTQGCRMGAKRRRTQSGTALTNDCWNGTNYNSGCGVGGPPESYGEKFNANGGAIYALELRADGIRAWMFGRDDVPSDLYFGRPDPSLWPVPMADFPNLECDIGKHFGKLKIVVNIALCGDWAGQPSVFNADERCTGRCEDWVQWRPDAFQEAYWEFGGFWVYKDIGGQAKRRLGGSHWGMHAGDVEDNGGDDG